MSDKQNSPKHNDVVRWHFTDAELTRRRHHNNGGTTYWCCSRIAVYDAEQGKYRDTYWRDVDEIPSDCTKWFSPSQIEFNLLGNLADFEKTTQRVAEMYAEGDYMDLSHANSQRGNMYVRKGATPNLSVMVAAIEQKITTAEADLRSAEYRVEWLKRDREELLTKYANGENKR